MLIEPIPAFRDNYLWLLSRDGCAAIVDPGDAVPVREALARRELILTSILVTHHHADHSGGVAELAEQTGAAVYVPAGERIDCGAATPTRLRQGDRVAILGDTFEVLDVPGHTAGHIAYFAASLRALFCGDTLFAGGCGRLFEGTASQMVASLQQLAALPADTRVFCAHEYTLSNLAFAIAADPDNLALRQRIAACEATRAQGQPTVPSTVADELATNPFLRIGEPALRDAAERFRPGADAGDTSVFAALREWKNVFR